MICGGFKNPPVIFLKKLINKKNTDSYFIFQFKIGLNQIDYPHILLD